MRFYAGMPLVADGDNVLGTLCVLDTVPRPAGLTAAQMNVLSTVSMQVVSQFELRRSLAEQRASNRERNALARIQAAVPTVGGNLDVILAALVANTRTRCRLPRGACWS